MTVFLKQEQVPLTRGFSMKNSSRELVRLHLCSVCMCAEGRWVAGYRNVCVFEGLVGMFLQWAKN